MDRPEGCGGNAATPGARASAHRSRDRRNDHAECRAGYRAGLSHFSALHPCAAWRDTAGHRHEGDWKAARRLEEAFAPPARSGEAWHSTLNLPFSGTYRIYVRAVDRLGGMSPITETASDIEPFVHRSGEIARQVYGGGKGWERCEITRGMIGADGGIRRWPGARAEIDAKSRCRRQNGRAGKWGTMKAIAVAASADGIRFVSPPIDLASPIVTLEAQRFAIRRTCAPDRTTGVAVPALFAKQGAPYRHEQVFDGAGDFGASTHQTTTPAVGSWTPMPSTSSRNNVSRPTTSEYRHEMTPSAARWPGSEGAERGVATMKAAAWRRHMNGHSAA